MNYRQAVILAGGKGTRLRERLDGRPKPLVEIAGMPLLGRQLATLRQKGFTNVIVLVNHAAGLIEEYCASAAFADLRITTLDDGEPRGTAGALLHAFDHLEERFLVIYGDTLFDVDLERFWQEHLKRQAVATLFLHPNDHPFDSDLVEIDEERRVTRFHPAPHPIDGCLRNLVNAALYVIEKSSIAFWRDVPAPSDIARDLFPAMLDAGAPLRGYVSYEYIKDIGTPKRLDKAVSHLKTGVVARARRDQRQKAVFLDRDGTINQLRGYLSRPDEIFLLDGVGQAVKWLNDNEYRTVVITNQPVLARGEASFDDMRRIHGRMETLLGQDGAFLDAIYLCPHHPDKGFPGEVPILKTNCLCRKPEIGLIECAQSDLNIDLGKSWFVGDTTADVLAASKAGLLSILVGTGEGGRDNRYPVRPDFTADDLLGAIRIIEKIFPTLHDHASGIAEQLLPGAFVMVGGLARQGKSSFASALKYVLQARDKSAEILSLDGFLREERARLPGVLGRYDLLAVQSLLRPWLLGSAQAAIPVPIYDRFVRGPSTVHLQLSLQPNTILIVEGVPALHMSVTTDRPVLRIFVDGAEEERKERVIRDLMWRGHSFSAAETIYRNRLDDEIPIILSERDRANFVVQL
ncbi:HAD-IIIA family hydrolase [Bradyrhizobium sp. USDA 4502]